LAERLTENGIEAVPVFWLATEDHDFAEVNHAWVYDHDHQPSRLECIASPVPNQPVGGIALDGFDWDALATALNGLPFTDQVLDLAKNAYRPGVSMGQSFRELTSALLGRHQLLYVDPMAESVRRMAAPLMRDAIAKGKLLKKKLLERNKELTAAGYHAQVHVDEHNTLAFLLEDGRRLSLRRPNDHYVVGGRLISVADMQNQAEHLSPNALLRPVVQDYILPTIAYIGGPAELAYLAQSEVLYRELLGRQPVALHRTGFTLLDARSQKLMNRYGICLPDFFHGEHELKERIAARLIPQELKVLVSRQSVSPKPPEDRAPDTETGEQGCPRNPRQGRDRRTQCRFLERSPLSAQASPGTVVFHPADGCGARSRTDRPPVRPCPVGLSGPPSDHSVGVTPHRARQPCSIS